MSQVWQEAVAPRAPFRREGLAGRLAPLAGAATLAILVGDLGSSLERGLPALAGGALLVGLILVSPWDHLPRWLQALPPLVGIALLAASRWAGGPSELALFPLLLFVVLWLALHHTRVELLAGLVLATLALVLPGGRGLAWVDPLRGLAISMLLALGAITVEELVRQAREQAAEMATVAHVVRSISRADPEEARSAICQGLLAVCGGAAAMLLEPASGKHLVTTAMANGRLPEMVFELDREGDAPPPLEAFRTGRPVLSDSFVDYPDDFARRVRPSLASSLAQPVLRDGVPVGVLMVAWSRGRRHLQERTALAVGLFADEAALVVQQADLLARLAASARTDALTETWNRRAWEEELPLAVARSSRAGRPLCVAVLDLDRFKALNDSRGHQEGDRVLRRLGRSWREALRKVDFLARYGGDEFGVILPDCDVASAVRILNRLREVTPEGLGCSAGVAAWNGYESHSELVARADAALYLAKRSGAGIKVSEKPARLVPRVPAGAALS
jgi:diguanylate cyclase (GGDEF)-like protein